MQSPCRIEYDETEYHGVILLYVIFCVLYFKLLKQKWTYFVHRFKNKVRN